MKKVTVRMLGALEVRMKEQGLSPELEVEVPEGGMRAAAIADQIEIPRDMIEAVFINGRAKPVEEVVFPGDRLVILPPGIPGPYRVLLGITGTKNRGNQGEK